jgi:hypothetical protein
LLRQVPLAYVESVKPKASPDQKRKAGVQQLCLAVRQSWQHATIVCFESPFESI